MVWAGEDLCGSMLYYCINIETKPALVAEVQNSVLSSTITNTTTTSVKYADYWTTTNCHN